MGNVAPAAAEKSLLMLWRAAFEAAGSSFFFFADAPASSMPTRSGPQLACCVLPFAVNLALSMQAIRLQHDSKTAKVCVISGFRASFATLA